MDTFLPPDASAPPPEASDWSGRYTPIEILGEGGMGVVWRVLDPTLGRHVALKVLQPHIQASTQAIQRFNTEAKLTAQLQHPAIVPVYEAGRLEDGRLYFTMKEIRGTTLRQVIAERSLRLRRQLDAFGRVCQAIAYAHSRGVIHRDIKPDNIMIGEFGEVMVMDWGVARLLGDVPDGGGEGIIGTGDALKTRLGALVGTPSYMAPELIEGEPPSPASDVYALGAVLFEILTGTPRYTGPSAEVFSRILSGDGADLPLDAPVGLQLACEQAMSADPGDRFPDAGALSEAISDWLDGVRLRDQAMACVAAADALGPQIEQLTAEAAGLRGQAAALLDGVRSYDPVEQKKPAWSLEDRAETLEREARQHALTVTRQLHAALNILPTLPEAHARLAAHYHAEHVAAEQRNDARESERLEALLSRHDLRRRFTGYLTGDGAVTLITDPPGVTVALHRIVEIERRLTPVLDRVLGTTPLAKVSLPRGRYLLVLSAPGFHDVRYPVTIGRQEHWHGVPPGEREAAPIWMPPLGSLSEGECYVPAGWFVAGGDAEALDPLPLQRVWADGFVMQKHPVTRGEYLALVQAAAEVEPALARTMLPMRMGDRGVEQSAWEIVDGHVVLPTDGPERPKLPMVSITWHAAKAAAEWVAQSCAQPWRLPHELEWEKAARGVDGRIFPWGDHFEATWACGMQSHAVKPGITPIGRFAGDRGVYQVHGVSGNVSEWTSSIYEKVASVHNRLVLNSPAPVAQDALVIRGGSFTFSSRMLRLATRTATTPERWFSAVGMRLVRSVPY